MARVILVLYWSRDELYVRVQVPERPAPAGGQPRPTQDVWCPVDYPDGPDGIPVCWLEGERYHVGGATLRPAPVTV